MAGKKPALRFMSDLIKKGFLWFRDGLYSGAVGPGLLLLTVAALSTFLVGLTRYPLNGDEYNSILEAQQLGLNWQSLAYSLLLKGWMGLGASDAWLRMLSVFFGLGSVYLVYACASLLCPHPWNLAAGILAATSPFLVYHAQEVRFYTLFIFSSTLFLWLVLGWVASGCPRKGLVWLVPSAALLIFSHFLGVLAATACLLFALVNAQVAPVGAQVALVSTQGKKSRWLWLSFTALGLLLVFAIPLIPGVQQGLWQLYQAVAHTTTASPVTVTPVTLLSLAKAAVAGYVLALGYHTYPLELWLVIPGILLIVITAGLGTWKLVRERSWAPLLIFYAIIFLGIYVVLDAVGGRLAGGVAPRHVAFLAPVLLLLVAAGLSALSARLAQVVFGLLVLVNLAGLVQRWQGDWSYGTLTDYRQAAGFAAASLQTGDLVLHDGRSGDPVRRYFPAELPLEQTWNLPVEDPLAAMAGFDRLLFVSNDYQLERRIGLNRLLAQIEKQYAWSAGRVDYPLFEYVFQRKPEGVQGYRLDAETGQLLQPLSIYGLEFEDLSLPLDLQVEGERLHVVGAFSLPDLEGVRTRQMLLEQPLQTKALILLTTLLDAGDMEDGTQVARVTLSSPGGDKVTIPIRLGEETQAWDRACAPEAACETVYTWHKRLALLGQRAYPQAWRDFQAGLHVVKLPIPGDFVVESISLDYLGQNGNLYIWAVSLN